MKAMSLTLVFIILFPTWGLAEDNPTPTPQGQNVVVVTEGQAAPFTGLLVKEARMTELVEAELSVADLRGKLEIERRFAKSIEDTLEKRLLEATKPTPWYEQPDTNRWIGFAIGVVVTGLVVWGGVEVMKAIK